MKKPKVSRLAALTLAVLLLTGCAGQGTTSATEDARIDRVDEYSESATLAAFSGGSYDYEPFRTTSAMADAVPLVVDGVVRGVREGRTTTVVGTESTLSTSVVLIIADVSAVKGELPNGDGNVYIELLDSGHALDVYARAFPEGSRVVAYIEPAWDGAPAEGADIEIPEGSAGRPEGEPLYMLPPQGIAVQVDSHDVVWPLVGDTAEGSIEQFLPGGTLIRG
ncbi:hypothetical protein [uncultured Microbacterium sp.]|uniref:hypothetical protein n=1 Tax=uncultured Microbacterium sp. TaxID=191216 RepID=UPI002638518C|nr:hypothetical protein [uncultured Microbacterium sp.]